MDPERLNFDPEPSLQEQKEPVKSEQEIVWDRKMGEVNGIVDHFGTEVDEKIKESVCAFLIHGFTTSSSCEGHMAKEGEKQHDSSYPWIEICVPEPEGLREAEGEKKEQLEQEWMVKNFEQQRKMIRFLEEFYKGRKTPFDARLIFGKIRLFGSFRVQSFGAEMTAILSPEEKRQKLALYQKEMEDFTKFLKDKYFSKE